MNVIRILLEITVYSAILFALVLLVKRIFKKQFSPSMQYFIWFLLIARLALPFTVQSSASFFTIPYEAQSVRQDTAPQTAPGVTPQVAPTAAPQAQTTGEIQENAHSVDTTVSGDVPALAQEQASTPVQATPTHISPPDIDMILLIVWAAGAVLVCGRTLAGYAGLARRLKRTSLLPTREVLEIVRRKKLELGIRRKLSVRLQYSLSTPALTASLFPRLLLPVSMLRSPEKMEFGILHELVHFKRGDYIVCIILLILRTVYWFNPIVWLMQKPLKTDMEASCDSVAAARFGVEGKKRYASTILELFSKKRRPQLILGMSLPGNKKTAEKRIRGIFMKSTTKKSFKLISVLIAAVLFVVCFTTACQPVKEISPGITPSMTFEQGTSVEGVDISGKTFEQGKTVIAPQAERMLSQKITYQTPAILTPQAGSVYSHTLAEAGACVDYESVLEKAMVDGGKNHPLEYAFDDAALNLLITQDSNGWDKAQPSYDFEKFSDEEALTTGGELVQLGTPEGFAVDTAAMIDIIKRQAAAKRFSEFEVPGEMKKVGTGEASQDALAVIGSFETAYGSSAMGRRYNIWKMADIINGVKIDPGEAWSINEQAGPRTYSRGWKGAPGISNGEYQEEAGGGICQVSSTLYGAALRAELKIVDRSHHSWPLSYVQGGLDATISTGAPDLRLQNPYSVPVYIVATCDGGDKKIKVEIYGPPFADGLTRDFSSELISESYSGGEKIVPDPSMPEGQTVTKQAEHPFRVYEVYKHWYDADGNEVRQEKFSTETYSAFPAIVYAGTSVSPSHEPAPAPEPSADIPEAAQPSSESFAPPPVETAVPSAEISASP